MSKPWVFAAIILATAAAAGGVARQMDRLAVSNGPTDPHPRSVLDQETITVSNDTIMYGQAVIPKGQDNHFWTQATINGRTIRLMVDTGASSIALPKSTAIGLGIAHNALVFDQPVRTANGEVMSARVTLNSVEVGTIRLDHVEALVVENGLTTPLLGMSFLGRLSKTEFTPTQLILKR